MSVQSYDVVIVGAGMVGAALACALGDTDLRVAIIEAKPPLSTWPKDSTDLRVSAITQASQRIFTAVDAWRDMTAQRVSPFRDMHVWDAGGSGAIHFDSAHIGRDTLGYIIENRVIQHALINRLQRCDNITLLCPAEVASLASHDDHVTVGLGDGTLLHATLLVGADGADSRVRKMAGIAVQRRDYEQRAVVATVETALPHRDTAWQRFLPAGPLAFLPLWDGRSSIVWSTTPAHAERLCALDDGAFNNELTQAFDNTLGAARLYGPRASFVLRRQHVDHYSQGRVVLVGDAAHTVHPLAGQGVNLGLLDAAALAEVILDAAGAHKDIGATRVLRRYERWRKGDNQLMMMVLDGFKHLFGSSLPPIKLARNAGMHLFNHSNLIKNHIMYHAMGLKGDLPRLAC